MKFNLKLLQIIVATIIASAILSCSTTKNFTHYNLEHFLQENYIEGSSSFYDLMFANTQYPEEARTENEAGQVKVELYISPNGSIDRFNITTELGESIKKTVENSLKLTDGKWKQADTTRILRITFGFKTNRSKSTEGDIIVMGFIN